MGQLRLNLLVIFLVGLLPVLSFGGAEEPPPPSEGICYKVFYEANFNELIKLRPHDYSSKISEYIASTLISDMKYFKCECGNEAIPYITGGNQGIDEIKNIYQKTICQFFVFLVNQDKNMVLIKLKINN